MRVAVSPQRCQRIDAQIDSDLAVVLGRFGVNGPRFDSDAHEPSIGDFGDRRRHNFPLKTQFLPHRNPPDMRQTNLFSFDLEMIVADGEPVITAFGSVTWIGPSSFKKVDECFTQVLDGHLRGAFRHLQHPWELFFLQRIEAPTQFHLARVGDSRVHCMHGVDVSPRVKRPIVSEAGNARRPSKIISLL